MIRRFLILSLACLSVLLCHAQLAKQADALFANGSYEEAFPVYMQLLEASPKNALYLYRIGRCHYELGNDSLAETYLLQSGDKYALCNFYLAELAIKNYRFKEATDYFQTYLESIDSTSERYEYVHDQLLYCQVGRKMLRRTQRLTIVDSLTLPKSQFLNAYRLSSEAGSLLANNQCVTYLTGRKDKKYMSEDNGGQLDIVMTMQLFGQLTEVERLSQSVNSEFDENYPFLSSDGITLYFASNRPDGLGGYDIYQTQYNSDIHDYRQCENVGFPFNSSANDYMMALDEEKGIGYFATDRFVADSFVTVYSFLLPNEPNYVQNEDSLSLFARLLTFDKQMFTDTLSVLPMADNQESMQPYFVVSDSVVYQHWADFPTDEAVRLYKLIFALQQTVEQDSRRLEHFRYEYKKGDNDLRDDLAEPILSLEKQLLLDSQNLKQQEKALRQYIISLSKQ